MTTGQDIKTFFENKRKKVADQQQKITKNVLDNLFRLSPHHDPMRDDPRFADSEYDANHKATVNMGTPSQHRNKTFNEALSNAYIDIEARYVKDSVRCGDIVTVSNYTDHAKDVEFGPMAGGNFWQRGGYYVYTKTKRAFGLI